jgi:hypothetical protein
VGLSRGNTEAGLPRDVGRSPPGPKRAKATTWRSSARFPRTLPAPCFGRRPIHASSRAAPTATTGRKATGYRVDTRPVLPHCRPLELPQLQNTLQRLACRCRHARQFKTKSLLALLKSVKIARVGGRGRTPAAPVAPAHSCLCACPVRRPPAAPEAAGSSCVFIREVVKFKHQPQPAALTSMGIEHPAR